MQYKFISVLKDNYIWVLYNNKNEALIFDCGDAKATLSFLQENNLKLKYILVTHHHYDHIDGVFEVAEETGALVVGNNYFSDVLPPLNIGVEDGGIYNFLGHSVLVKSAPGHCQDLILYYFKRNKWLFCSDLLFSLGCGGIFDGTPEQMVHSLSMLNIFPKEALVFPGHEYAKSNLRFLQSLNICDTTLIQEQINSSDYNSPTSLEFEYKYNPFLNLDNKKFVDGLLLNDNGNVNVFQSLKYLKAKNLLIKK